MPRVSGPLGGANAPIGAGGPSKLKGQATPPAPNLGGGMPVKMRKPGTMPGIKPSGRAKTGGAGSSMGGYKAPKGRSSGNQGL